MKTEYSKSIMATYATFKELYASKKYSSPYQILSEFIKYIIASNSLYSFTSTDIQSHLIKEFGFHPPIAVIRTALKSIPDVTRNNQTYVVSTPQRIDTFLLYRKQAEEKSDSITKALLEFAEEKNKLCLNKDKLSQELIAFVLDEDGDPQYQQIIGSFVLFNEDNKAVTTAISAIREGSILYTGLAFNISEFGSIKQPITLFLDTEILFDIAGLNGLLFKTLSDDFLKLVNIANQGRKTIQLKFFSKVSDDIDQFYGKAEEIVSGHGEINFTTAMKTIIDGCKDTSDVSDKRVELYQKLRSEHAVVKDDKENYYTDSDNAYNLEGIIIAGYPNADQMNAEGYMFCSHINKLRKGQQTTDLFSSRYICITDTRRVLDISHALVEHEKNQITGEKYCDYAVSLNHITNLLWYKLNQGFGSNDFPKNLDIVFRARSILSSYITQKIAYTYKDIRSKADSGELTPQQAAARIIALKEKALLPEELDADNIEETLDFSEEHLSKFEETIAQNKLLLTERDKTIETLLSDMDHLQEELDHTMAENNDKQQQIDALTQRINEIEDIEKEKKRKKQKRKALLCFIWSIFWKILIASFVIFLIWFICKLLKIDFPTWLGIVLSAVGIIISALQNIKKNWQTYKNNIQ